MCKYVQTRYNNWDTDGNIIDDCDIKEQFRNYIDIAYTLYRLEPETIIHYCVFRRETEIEAKVKKSKN